MINIKKIIILFFSVFLIFSFTYSVNAKGFSYGISKTTNHERPNPGGYIQTILNDTNSYYIGSDDKRIYLTFDCGYENGYTLKILDALKNTNTKACFFITGHYLTSSLDIVKRMIEDGHIIGNHTYHHNDFNKSNTEEILEDVKKLEDKYYSLTGYKISNFVRPPEGKASKESLQVLSSKGYTNVFWSLAYIDWYKDKINGKEYSYNNVLSRIHNGAIILMHTVSKDNADALEDIIIDLNKQGYLFSSLNEL